jgi:hypothetical protein
LVSLNLVVLPWAAVVGIVCGGKKIYIYLYIYVCVFLIIYRL